jgi:hypothetical protein
VFNARVFIRHLNAKARKADALPSVPRRFREYGSDVVLGEIVDFRQFSGRLSALPERHQPAFQTAGERAPRVPYLST